MLQVYIYIFRKKIHKSSLKFTFVVVDVLLRKVVKTKIYYEMRTCCLRERERERKTNKHKHI